MSELTLTVVRLAFVVLLWALVLIIVSVMRADLRPPRLGLVGGGAVLLAAGAALRVVDASILRAAFASEGVCAIRTPGLVDLTIHGDAQGRWMANIRRGKEWRVIRRHGKLSRRNVGPIVTLSYKNHAFD